MSLIEAEEQRKATMDQIFERLGTMDTRIRALENTSIGASESQQQRTGGTSKGGANDHLSVKVSPPSPSLSIPTMP